MAKIKSDMEYKIIYKCPVCSNEEIEMGQNYCQICGEALKWQEVEIMSENYYNQVRKEMESAGIVESDIVAAISIIKKLHNEKQLYVLTDACGEIVVCNNKYDDLEEAKADLEAEFYCFTCDDNTIEYGKDCFQAEDSMSAWARLGDIYRIWKITEVLP